MTGTARSQYAIDLDEIERQIREASTTSTRGGGQGDPLTELARIVETSPQPTRAPRFAAPPSHLEPPARIAPEPTLPPMPRRPPDELEEAMRTLDEFFKNDRPPSEPIAAPVQPVDDPYGDWDLRGAAPAPAVRDTRYDSEHHVAASGHAPHDGSVRAAAPGNIDDRYWDEPAPPAAYPAAPPPLAKPSRRPMILAASVLGVAVIGVAGALSLRGAGGKAPGGIPPIIKAESGPSKVAPANPGGLEIPDQDIQILQRSPSRGKSVANVVNNEEEPVDLREAVRREAAANAQAAAQRPVDVVTVPPPAPLQRVEPVPVAPAPVAAPAPPPSPAAPPPVATPAAPPPAVAPAAPPVAAEAAPAPAVTPPQPPAASVPEPRRVKTVAIRPPDPPAPPAPPPPAPVPVAAVAAPPPAPVAVPVAPVAPPPAPASAPPPAVAVAPSEPPPPAAPKPKVQGSIRETTGTVRAPAPAPVVNAPPLQITPAPSQVASLGRDPMRASTPPAPPPLDPPAETRPAAAPSGGGFVVQLTSEGSEESARAAIGRAQGRFSELSGYTSSIQRREVNGQMRYRVRFGSMSRADANGLCAKLKSKGQDCIIQTQ